VSKPRSALPGGAFSRALARVLRDAFEESKLTQAALGQLIGGVSQSQVSKYLLAKRPVNVDELDAICAALGLDIVAVVRAAKKDEVQGEVHEGHEPENTRPDFGI
jgi:transcriptional regulator with XRE-family HTH domain